jgi:mRNA interferase MazF
VLDPTVGSEIQKARPCLVISPNEMTQWLRTVIAAPLTSQGFPAPFRVPIKVQGKAGLVILDQLRALDKACLTQKLGKTSPAMMKQISTVLQEMFSVV